MALYMRLAGSDPFAAFPRRFTEGLCKCTEIAGGGLGLYNVHRITDTKPIRTP